MPGPPPVWRIPDLERNRNISLFYSLVAEDGLLGGEQARELFVRSKLELPDLSQIWSLADFDEDGSLSLPEFLIAMHLIQAKRSGGQLPESTPEGLLPRQLKSADIPPIIETDAKAYAGAFKKLDTNGKGMLSGLIAKPVLKKSCLPVAQLAQVWSLADMDEDGQLTYAEFSLCMHLMRYLRKGYLLPNSVDGPALTKSCLVVKSTLWSAPAPSPDGNAVASPTGIHERTLSIPTRTRKQATITEPSDTSKDSSSEVSATSSATSPTSPPVPPPDESQVTPVSDRQRPTKRGNRWVSFSSKRPAGYLRESSVKAPSGLATQQSSERSPAVLSPVKSESGDDKPPTDAFFLSDENPFTNDSFASLTAREDAGTQQQKVADPFSAPDLAESDPFSSSDPFHSGGDDPFGTDDMFADPFSSTAKAIGEMPSISAASPMSALDNSFGGNSEALGAVFEEREPNPSTAHDPFGAVSPSPAPASAVTPEPSAASVAGGFTTDPFASSGGNDSGFGGFNDSFGGSLPASQPVKASEGAFDPFGSVPGTGTSTSGKADAFCESTGFSDSFKDPFAAAPSAKPADDSNQPATSKISNASSPAAAFGGFDDSFGAPVEAQQASATSSGNSEGFVDPFSAASLSAPAATKESSSQSTARPSKSGKPKPEPPPRADDKYAAFQGLDGEGTASTSSIPEKAPDMLSSETLKPDTSSAFPTSMGAEMSAGSPSLQPIGDIQASQSPARQPDVQQPSIPASMSFEQMSSLSSPQQPPLEPASTTAAAQPNLASSSQSSLPSTAEEQPTAKPASAAADPFTATFPSSSSGGSVGNSSFADSFQAFGSVQATSAAPPSENVALVKPADVPTTAAATTAYAPAPSQPASAATGDFGFDDAFAAKAASATKQPSATSSFDDAFNLSSTPQPSTSDTAASGFGDAFGASAWQPTTSTAPAAPEKTGFSDAFSTPGKPAAAVISQTSLPSEKPGPTSSTGFDPFGLPSFSTTDPPAKEAASLPASFPESTAASATPADPFGSSFSSPATASRPPKSSGGDPFGDSFASPSATPAAQAASKPAPPAIPPSSRFQSPGPQPLAPLQPTPTKQPLSATPDPGSSENAPPPDVGTQQKPAQQTGFGDAFMPFTQPATTSAAQPSVPATTGSAASQSAAFPAPVSGQSQSIGFGDSFAQPLQPSPATGSGASAISSSLPPGSQPPSGSDSQPFGGAFSSLQPAAAGHPATGSGASAFSSSLPPSQPPSGSDSQPFGGAFSSLQPAAAGHPATGCDASAFSSSLPPSQPPSGSDSQPFGGAFSSPQPAAAGHPVPTISSQQPPMQPVAATATTQGFGDSFGAQPQAGASPAPAAFGAQSAVAGGQPTQGTTLPDGAQPGVASPAQGALKPDREDKKKQKEAMQKALVLDIDKEWADLMSSTSPALKSKVQHTQSDATQKPTGRAASFGSQNQFGRSPAAAAAQMGSKPVEHAAELDHSQKAVGRTASFGSQNQFGHFPAAAQTAPKPVEQAAAPVPAPAPAANQSTAAQGFGATDPFGASPFAAQSTAGGFGDSFTQPMAPTAAQSVQVTNQQSAFGVSQPPTQPAAGAGPAQGQVEDQLFSQVMGEFQFSAASPAKPPVVPATSAEPVLSPEEAEKARLERVAKMKTKVQAIPDFDKRQAMLEEKRQQREAEFLKKQEEEQKKDGGSAASGIRRSSVLASKWEQQVSHPSQPPLSELRQGSVEGNKALERRLKEEEELKRRQAEHDKEVKLREAEAERQQQKAREQQELKRRAEEEQRKKAEREREEAAAAKKSSESMSPKAAAMAALSGKGHQSSPQQPSIDFSRRPTAPRKNSLAQQWEQKFGGK